MRLSARYGPFGAHYRRDSLSLFGGLLVLSDISRPPPLLASQLPVRILRAILMVVLVYILVGLLGFLVFLESLIRVLIVLQKTTKHRRKTACLHKWIFLVCNLKFKVLFKGLKVVVAEVGLDKVEDQWP